jgi:PhzF family phenazine biosynthesis protein
LFYCTYFENPRRPLGGSDGWALFVVLYGRASSRHVGGRNILDCFASALPQMELAFTTLDVFTKTRYMGNPVAIVQVPAVSKTHLTQAQKQAIAWEFNLSEIVFMHLPPSGSTFNEIIIDIFTSKAELPFAGHPTIGSAAYLLNIHGKKTSTIVTKAGRIPIKLDEDTGEVKAVVPQTFHIHAVKYTSELTPQPAETTSIVNGMSFICVPLPDLATLEKADRNLHDEHYEPLSLDEGWRNGLLGTMYYVAQGEDRFGRRRFRTRMFSFREDPGTGSASCALGCYLAGKIPASEGKGPFQFAFEQGVEMGRRNEISVEVIRGDRGEGIEKVVLSGRAVKVMEGTLTV